MPAPPWTPEHAITEELAQSLIEGQFPALHPVKLKILGVGWDNTAILVNDRFVFRFPRRAIAVPLLEAEIRVLPKIVRRLPLPIPVPLFVGKPDSGYPWTFAGYERLEGRTACSAALGEAERVRMAAPLAEFLTILHSIRPEEAHWLGAPRDEWNRFDMQRKVPHTRDRLAELTSSGLIADPAPFLAIVDQAPSMRAARPSALTHGDLYVRHLLVDEHSELSIIDWGDVHIGDVAVDLAIACGFLSPAGREIFRQVYRNSAADSETWRLARFHMLYHACITTRYGHGIGDADLVREGLIALDHVLSSR